MTVFGTTAFLACQCIRQAISDLADGVANEAHPTGNRSMNQLQSTTVQFTKRRSQLIKPLRYALSQRRPVARGCIRSYLGRTRHAKVGMEGYGTRSRVMPPWSGTLFLSALLRLEPLACELQRAAVLGDGPHDRIGRPRRDFGVNLKRHRDPRPHEASQV